MLTEFPEDERKTIKQNKNFDNLFLPTEQESLRPVLWGLEQNLGHFSQFLKVMDLNYDQTLVTILHLLHFQRKIF